MVIPIFITGHANPNLVSHRKNILFCSYIAETYSKVMTVLVLVQILFQKTTLCNILYEIVSLYSRCLNICFYVVKFPILCYVK